MSRNSGEYIHRPAKGQAENPVSVGHDLPVPVLAVFPDNFVDCVGVMAITIDRRGIIRQFNQKAEALTGYSRDEALGQDWFSLMLAEQERDSARIQLMNGLRPGVEHSTFHMPVMARDGSRLPVCWSMSAVRDEEGKASGLVCLGFLPARHGAPCLEASRQIEGYCSTVGIMTHDLLNHSQVVLGYLEMAAERTGDNKELRCMLERATRSMVKCGDITAKMHKLSQSHLK
jgi:PAS domain S-box-containing protein